MCEKALTVQLYHMSKNQYSPPILEAERYVSHQNTTEPAMLVEAPMSRGHVGNVTLSTDKAYRSRAEHRSASGSDISESGFSQGNGRCSLRIRSELQRYRVMDIA
jgi:hypothetical protein